MEVPYRRPLAVVAFTAATIGSLLMADQNSYIAEATIPPANAQQIDRSASPKLPGLRIQYFGADKKRAVAASRIYRYSLYPGMDAAIGQRCADWRDFDGFAAGTAKGSLISELVVPIPMAEKHKPRIDKHSPVCKDGAVTKKDGNIPVYRISQLPKNPIQMKLVSR